MIYRGPGRIAICIGTRGIPAGFRIYRNLAPTLDLFRWSQTNDDWDKYTERFEGEVLSKLDPQRTYHALVALVAPAEPVLLCYEKPGYACHRQLVADWFNTHLDVDVPEMGLEGHDDYTVEGLTEKAIMVQRNAK